MIVLVVVLVTAPSRPPLLVAASVLAVCGLVVLRLVAPSVHALGPQERRRLQVLRRAL